MTARARCGHQSIHNGRLCNKCKIEERNMAIFNYADKYGWSREQIAKRYKMKKEAVRDIIEAVREDSLKLSSTRWHAVERQPCGHPAKQLPRCNGQDCYHAVNRNCPAFEAALKEATPGARDHLLSGHPQASGSEPLAEYRGVRLQ